MADSDLEQEYARAAAIYLRFAEDEAHGRSPLYETLARGVAGDRETLDFLLTLPRPKRQAQLLLAAVRHLFGTPADWPQFRRMILEHGDEVRAVMMARSTQTNEPARCATLLPLLKQLPQPLALLEVGASAGLCLLPDFYAYDFGRGVMRPQNRDRESPIFACAVDDAVPIPSELPRVVWRAGLDLNPLDVADPSHAAWLENLVWPGQDYRVERLRRAIAIAAAVRPRIVKGDLRRGLARLAAEAPRDATLVIFHTAVLGYVAPAADREQFARDAMSLCDYWICNEYHALFPDIARRTNTAGPRNRFLLALNGAPIGWTHPHGESLQWIADTLPPPNR